MTPSLIHSDQRVTQIECGSVPLIFKPKTTIPGVSLIQKLLFMTTKLSNKTVANPQPRQAIEPRCHVLMTGV